MISITRTGLTGWDEAIIDQWAAEFSDKQCIVIPGLIEESLLEKILKSVEQAFFFENSHIDENEKIFATDQTIDHKNLALHQVHFLLNNKKLFNAIERITGCDTIGGFSGRIYRNMPGTGHQLAWHDDTSEKSRLVGLSMNIGRQPYVGGTFQIRRKGADNLLREVPCGKPGDTHIFNVSAALEHRVIPTTGSYPRIAVAGWFTTESGINPSFFKLNS